MSEGAGFEFYFPRYPKLYRVQKIHGSKVLKIFVLPYVSLFIAVPQSSGSFLRVGAEPIAPSPTFFFVTMGRYLKISTINFCRGFFTHGINENY